MPRRRTGRSVRGASIDGAALVSPIVGDQVRALRWRRRREWLKKLVDKPQKVAGWLILASWLTGFVLAASHNPAHAAGYVALIGPLAGLLGVFGAGGEYLQGRRRLWKRGITVIAYADEQIKGTYRFVDAAGKPREHVFVTSWARSERRPVEIEICYHPEHEQLVRRRKLNPLGLFWASFAATVGAAGMLGCIAIWGSIWRSRPNRRPDPLRPAAMPATGSPPRRA